MSAATYVGGELALFERAYNWKDYLREQLRELVRGRVLEVGAGVGATTRALAAEGQRSWLCLEPDPALAAELSRACAAIAAPRVEIQVGTLAALPPDATFDTVLYADVLEHIERDAAELVRAAAALARGGHLIVLSPAHSFLMSDFDRAIGHYRRYTARSLAALAPPGLELVLVRYLDSCGMLASLGNRLWLRQSLPTAAQIAFWDRCMVPISRRLDRWLAYRLGKSVLVVWRRS